MWRLRTSKIKKVGDRRGRNMRKGGKNYRLLNKLWRKALGSLKVWN